MKLCAPDYNGVYRLHSRLTHMARFWHSDFCSTDLTMREGLGDLRRQRARGEHPSFLCERENPLCRDECVLSLDKLDERWPHKTMLGRFNCTEWSLRVPDLLVPFGFQTVCLRNECARLHPGTRPSWNKTHFLFCSGTNATQFSSFVSLDKTRDD